MAEKIFDADLRLNGPAGPLILTGTGAPEGVITAPVASEFIRTDGPPFRYIKVTGAGNTGWAESSDFRSPRRFTYFCDFLSISTDDVCSSQVAGTGAANAAVAWQFAGNPVGSGFIRQALGTVATNRAGWFSTVIAGIYARVSAFSYRVRGGLMTLSDATNCTYTSYLGLKDVVSAAPTNGIFFRYTNGVNGGRWQAVCRAAGVETAVDTGVTADITGNNTFEIRGATDGNTMTFFINGALVATITTNLPAITVGMGMGINFLRTVGTVATNAASWDYLMYTQDTPTRT